MPEIALTHADIDSLWDFNEPEATEARFRELLPRVQSQGDPRLHAELLSQIARTYSLRQRFAEAHATLAEALALVPAIEAGPRASVRIMLERGRTFNSNKQKTEALFWFEAAYALAVNEGLAGLAVDAAHMLAIAETGDNVLAWNERALELAEVSDDPAARKWLGSLYNNLGWTYHDRGDAPRALELFKRAEAFRREHGNPESQRVARWCVARCLRTLGRLDEALTLQEALLAELETTGGKDGFTHEELGELLLAKGREAEARPHFAAAHAVLSQDPWLTRDEPARLERLANLARG